MQIKIKDIKKRTKDTFSLIFEKPEGFAFYAGQYLDVELPVYDKKYGSSRNFTISSSPTEDFLMITTKKGGTLFKKFMASLKPGDTITASHPAGTFILDETEPAVFLAGGIGITPFRSMVKYVLDKSLSTPITLIYSNSDEDFIFKKELDSWQKHLPNLTIYYIVTNKAGRLNEEKLQQLYPRFAKRAKPYTLNPIFYLAGKPSMVDDFEEILLRLGVDSTNIRTDRFDGY